MKLMIVLLLNLYEHRKLNLLLVLHLSRFIEIGKRRWNTKCDRIFDETLKNGCIILLTHPLSTLNELKSHAYCKWHNSSSHTTMIVMSSVSRSNWLLIRNNYERWDWVRTMLLAVGFFQTPDDLLITVSTTTRLSGERNIFFTILLIIIGWSATAPFS